MIGSRRLVALLVAAALVLPACAGAHAKTMAGVVRDLPSHAPGVRDGAPGPVPRGPRGWPSPRVRARLASVSPNGGPVMHSNRAHLIFWLPRGSGLSFEPGYAALLEAFLGRVAADSHLASNVYGLSGQYRDNAGPAVYASAYAGAILDAHPLPRPYGCVEPRPAADGGPGWTPCVSDAQMQGEISRVRAAHRLPSGMNDVYFLVTPNGLGDCWGSGPQQCALGGTGSGYCGYHSVTNDGVLYAVIPYNAVAGHCQAENPRPNSSSADPAISTLAHEHIEMVTDPLGTGWLDAQLSEVGDICLTHYGPNLGGSTGASAYNELIHGGRYYIQEVWSNADNACEPSAAPERISFSSPPSVPGDRRIALVARVSTRQATVVAYDWFFGGAHGASHQRATHAFTSVGQSPVVLRTTDSWGNWAFAAQTISVFVPPPPVAHITAAPGSVRAGGRASIRFASSAAFAKFRCRLDRSTWKPCRSPSTTARLRRGEHSFSVRARDTFGQLTPRPAIHTFMVI